MFQRNLRERTLQMSRNTIAIKKSAPLQYLLITVQVVSLKKVSFQDTQNSKAVSQHIDSR